MSQMRTRSLDELTKSERDLVVRLETEIGEVARSNISEREKRDKIEWLTRKTAKILLVPEE